MAKHLETRANAKAYTLMSSFKNIEGEKFIMRRINESEYCHIEEATLIWHYSNGFSKEKGDIRWTYIDLYRTTSGEYCLHVSGGPGSDYASRENISSAWGDGLIHTDGEEIISLSPHQVIIWGEENLPDDVLKKVFKDIRQRAKRKNAKAPEILGFSEQKLAIREKETKIKLAAAKANAEVQARQEKYYEQFVEL